MYRRLLAKLRAVLATPADPSAWDARIDARLHERIGEEVDRRVAERLEQMARLTNDHSQPNINSLWRILKDLETVQLDVKLLGYQLGLAHEYRLQAIPVEAPGPFLADCKPATQGDMETRWFRYWCEQLRERPRYHRKLWEFAYVMQALHAAGALKKGARILVLGPDQQPAASYAAAQGAEVIVVQDPSAPLPGPGADPLLYEDLVGKAAFEKRVTRRQADLRALPDDLGGFDACISIGRANGFGSIEAGVAFLISSVRALKPGGVAAHVADFNFSDDERTLDNWTPALFQRRHFEAVAAAWTAAGHEVTPLDFNVGYQALDRFVDVPPFDVSRTEAMAGLWRDGWQAAHLKSQIDGFPVASFGMVVRTSRG
jgi:hypothetical protein